MHSYKNVLSFLSLSFVMSLASPGALAGDTLLLKSGTIKTADLSLSQLPSASKHAATSRRKNLFIVQFKTAIDSEDQKNLESLGAKILYYVPEDAFLVEASTTVARTIGVSSLHIKAVLPFSEDFKVSPELKSQLESDDEIKVKVYFAPVADLAARLKAEEPRLKKSLLPPNLSAETMATSSASSWLLKADSRLISHLAQLNFVDWIELAAAEPVAEPASVAESVPGWTSATVADFFKEQNISEPSRALVEGLKLHAAQAQNGLESLKNSLFIDEKLGLATSEEHIYPLDVHQEGRLQVTLSYSDAPHAPFAEIFQVNNLDLQILDEAGRAVDFKKSQSADGPTDSVEIKVPSGHYEIHIKGADLPQVTHGFQPYALIVSAH
jgi:hypothetical protein